MIYKTKSKNKNQQKKKKNVGVMKKNLGMNFVFKENCKN